MLGKIGSGFKWIGKKLLWVLQRNETLLIARFIPLPFLDKVVGIVSIIDQQNIPGVDKFEEVWKVIQPLLDELNMTDLDEARVTFIIELSVQIMKGNISALDTDDLK